MVGAGKRSRELAGLLRASSLRGSGDGLSGPEIVNLRCNKQNDFSDRLWVGYSVDFVGEG